MVSLLTALEDAVSSFEQKEYENDGDVPDWWERLADPVAAARREQIPLTNPVLRRAAHCLLRVGDPLAASMAIE